MKPRVHPSKQYGVPTPSLAAHPSDDDFRKATIFPEPLRPVPGTSSDAETDALAAALRDPTNDDRGIEALEHFLDAHPHSRWAPVLHLNLGTISYGTGYFQDALMHWKTAWELAKSGEDIVSRQIANQALAEYARMNGRVGRMTYDTCNKLPVSKKHACRVGADAAYSACLETCKPPPPDPGGVPTLAACAGAVRMKLSFTSIVAVALLTLACGPTPRPASSPVDAGTLMRGMRERYSSAASYRDRGRVHTTMRLGPDEVQATDLEFETAYVRSSGAFYFEYRATENTRQWYRGVAWQSNSGPTESWGPGDKVRSGTLAETLSSFAGVSHGVSLTVPGMLTGSIRSELMSRSFRVEGEEQLGAERCVKLASSESKGSVVLWVDKSSNALRRIVRDLVVTLPNDASKTVPVRDEIDYWPSFDQPIEDAEFAFAPPQ